LLQTALLRGERTRCELRLRGCGGWLGWRGVDAWLRWHGACSGLHVGRVAVAGCWPGGDAARAGRAGGANAPIMGFHKMVDNRYPEILHGNGNFLR
jgi:hypothetical protein